MVWYHSFPEYSRRESENFLKESLILSATYVDTSRLL